MIAGVLMESQTAHSEVQVRNVSQSAYLTAQSVVTPLMKGMSFGPLHLLK